MKMNCVYSTLIAFAVGMAIMAFFLGNRIEVVYSHKTGECVEVRSQDPDHSCYNLPAEFDRVWID